MKKCQENCQLFIHQSKTYFDNILAKPADISWNADRWMFLSSANGFLTSKQKESITFHEINTNMLKNTLKEGEHYKEKVISVDPLYAEFMKAFLTAMMSKSSKVLSAQTLKVSSLLLKRIYLRMLHNNIPSQPFYITSEIIQEAVDLLAKSRKSQSNAADDYTAMGTIVNYLNHVQITMTELELIRKVKVPPRATTKRAKVAKERGFISKEFAEDFSDEVDERNLSIDTFLNVVALRSLVESDAEKIMLNLVLLLIVTGMRFGEVKTLAIDAFKVIEIEDPDVLKLVAKRGLPTHYIGIQYQGEKGAGTRTHWIEPLATDIVELVYLDTIVLTEKLRKHVEFVRSRNFESYLPEIYSKPHENENATPLPFQSITLDEVLDVVYESNSKTVRERGLRAARDYAKKRLANYGVFPDSSKSLGQYNRKIDSYLLKDIDDYLRRSIERDNEVAPDFIMRINDTTNNIRYERRYEELLFIMPQCSSALVRAAENKLIPCHITHSDIMNFLGSSINSKNSVFGIYGLTDDKGNTTTLQTHIPRHAINTFFAIAGVTDHLQALFMGRTDTSQNKHYHHLAIEEKALSNTVISATINDSAPFLVSRLTANATALSVQQSFPIYESALNKVKCTGQISLNPSLNGMTAFNQAFQTYTTSKDRVDFIQDILESTEADTFSEFKEIFGVSTSKEKNDVIQSHAALYALNMGSCMRKLTTFECPFNLKCQDGTPCPYFTLTGREDEGDKIRLLLESIAYQIEMVDQMVLQGALSEDEAGELLEDFGVRKQHIEYQLKQIGIIESEKVLINLVQLDGMRKPQMLSTLFAIEQRKLHGNE